MDYLNKEDSSVFNLSVDETSKANLLEMARWAKFLAIMGFIGMAFLALAGIFAGAIGLSRYSASPLPGWAFTLIYIVIAGLYFYPILCLFRFSKNIKPAILSSNQGTFNYALGQLKSMFKFMGIMMIVVLVFYGIALIVGIAAAMMIR